MAADVQALEKVDAAEARRTLDGVDELGDMYAELKRQDRGADVAGAESGRGAL